MQFAIFDHFRSRLTETARLLKNVFKRSVSGVSLAEDAQRKTEMKRGCCRRELFSYFSSLFTTLGGFAFSQEEHGAVSQSDVVRAYDSTKSKPEGL